MTQSIFLVLPQWSCCPKRVFKPFTLHEWYSICPYYLTSIIVLKSYPGLIWWSLWSRIQNISLFVLFNLISKEIIKVSLEILSYQQFGWHDQYPSLIPKWHMEGKEYSKPPWHSWHWLLPLPSLQSSPCLIWMTAIAYCALSLAISPIPSHCSQSAPLKYTLIMSTLLLNCLVTFSIKLRLIMEYKACANFSHLISCLDLSIFQQCGIIIDPG